MQSLGIEIDEALNTGITSGKQGDISRCTSRIRVFVIPSDEELCIARQTLELVQASSYMKLCMPPVDLN